MRLTMFNLICKRAGSVSDGYCVSGLRFQLVGVGFIGCIVLVPLLGAQQPDVNDLFEKAVKEAAKKVAPSIVQIQTQGGSDVVVTSAKGAIFRKAFGPTSGVIVSSDGYIISSAFNFSNNPALIVVMIPGSTEMVVAKKIATDKSRMLTLIKVDKTNLPVPDFVPNKDLKVGQSSIALGRTLDIKTTDVAREHPPSISYGIISALSRVWGKAIQTDAKVSPINYGGPLVDITGRVQGIIIPASPTGDDVTAGFEWYDSGIGFAIPMEDALASVERLKSGKDLEKAVLGVQMKSKDQFGAAPEVANIAPGSAADKAGLKAGDVVTEIDGKAVVNFAQILHRLGPKYVGDSISLKVRRDKDEVAVAKLDLIPLPKQSYQHPFIGILPMRDDPKRGVEIRYVYPKSPADAAGLKAGDRIVSYTTKKEAPAKELDPGIDKNQKAKKAPKVDATQFKGDRRGTEELADFLNSLNPGTEITLGVVDRDGNFKGDVVIKLDTMPGSAPGQNDSVPERLPAVATAKRALEPLELANPNLKPPPAPVPEKGASKEKPDTGLIRRTSTAGDRRYWFFVPGDYNPQISYALVVWLHLPGSFSDEDIDKFIDRWEDWCKENHIILAGPITEQEGGWSPSDTDLVLEAVRDASANYSIDKNRIVAHGSGSGGQMAFSLAFRARETFRAAATLGAVMTEPLQNDPDQRLAFYLAAGDRDPVIKAIGETRAKLLANRFPVLYREFVNRGREYLDESALAELVRWIDSLDRL
jgi:S1-C subfamily serine protease/predicted esterase